MVVRASERTNERARMRYTVGRKKIRERGRGRGREWISDFLYLERTRCAQIILSLLVSEQRGETERNSPMGVNHASALLDYQSQPSVRRRRRRCVCENSMGSEETDREIPCFPSSKTDEKRRRGKLVNPSLLRCMSCEQTWPWVDGIRWWVNNVSVIVTFTRKCQAYLLCLAVAHVLEFSSSLSQSPKLWRIDIAHT